jgi:hypothetical protein
MQGPSGAGSHCSLRCSTTDEVQAALQAVGDEVRSRRGEEDSSKDDEHAGLRGQRGHRNTPAIV